MKVAPPKGTTTMTTRTKGTTWTTIGRRRLAWTQTHTSVPTCEAGHKCTEFGGECNTLAFPRYCDLETGLCRKDYNVSRPGTPVRQCMTSNTATKSPVIFDPQETTCTKIPYREDQKDITKMKVAAPRTATCTTTIKDNGQTQAETETNPIAELCAEYLFNFRDGTVDNAQLCCRHDDLELLRLVQTTIQGFTIQFGQCDNCLKTVKKQLCQMACDQDNSRFYLVRSNNSEPVVQAVCPEYCENIFLACKAVKWHDTIGFLFDTSTEFCKQVLNLEVIELPEPDQERRSDRICIAGVSVEPDIHCLGKQVHSSLGLTTTLLCGFIVVASVCAEIVEGLPCNVISIIPPATITLCVGMAFGALIKHAIAPSEEERDGTHHVLDFTSFDVELFIFLLLPVIIFSSAFNMDKPSVVFLVMKLKRTTMFAVFGTLIALFFNGACIWALNEKLGMLKHSLSLSEAMMFGSLISAVDPVATLAAFSTIGVDPRLYALIYGESILNDAVAIVAFRVWQTVSEQTSNPSMGSTLANAGLTFLTIGVGSLALGMLFGALVLLLFRFHGENPAHDLAEALVAHSKAKANQTDVDATEAKVAELHAHKHNHRSDHKAMLEASCFFFASLSSYYAAEALHISGIISALVCGLICNQWAVKMLSERAHDHAKRFYVTLSEICDSLIMLWVGLLFYLALDDMPWKFAVISLGLVMLSRAISVFGVAAGINAFASEGAGLPFKQQLMMFGGGLRGAVALALVMQTPSSSGEELAGATLFIIVATNIGLGGLTAPLVSMLGIHNEANGTLDLENFEFTDEEITQIAQWRSIDTRVREKFGAHSHDAEQLLVDAGVITADTSRAGKLMAHIHRAGRSVEMVDLVGHVVSDVHEHLPKKGGEEVTTSSGDGEVTENPIISGLSSDEEEDDATETPMVTGLGST